MAKHDEGHLCIGGPLDGRRIVVGDPSTRIESNCDPVASYTLRKIARRVEDYMTNPATEFIESARVLIWDDGPMPDPVACMKLLSISDWNEIEGSRVDLDSGRKR